MAHPEDPFAHPNSLRTHTYTWRPLTHSDIPSLYHLSTQLHPSLPEEAEVFAERQRLFPGGCLALVRSASDSESVSRDTAEKSNTEEAQMQEDQLYGYAIAHPIPPRCPPALDTLLTSIPVSATDFYIHDLALSPEARGRGLAKAGVEFLLGVAGETGLKTAALVSVYGTAAFWEGCGFKRVHDEGMRRKVEGYGEGAVFMERAIGAIGASDRK